MLDHDGVRILTQLVILRYFSRMHQLHIEISPPKYVKNLYTKSQTNLNYAARWLEEKVWSYSIYNRIKMWFICVCDQK